MGSSKGVRRQRAVARFVSFALLTALVASVVGTGVGVAQDAPPAVTDDVRGFAIDPPGQCGHIDFMSEECGHYEDQVEMYKALVKDDDVTEEELATYFKSMQFGPGANFGDGYSPTDGVTVVRPRRVLRAASAGR